jgi:hypothetical protein
MLAPIRKLGKRIALGLLLMFGLTFVSCATHRSVALVDDPDAQRESEIPWNKQEKWEVGGPLQNVSDRR